MVTEEQNRKACESKNKAKEIIEILEDREYIFMPKEVRAMMRALIERT